MGTQARLTPAEARRIARRCFAPAKEQYLGLEVEWITRRADGSPGRVPLPELRALGRIPLPANGRVTIEPGGQLELSSRPCSDVDSLLEAMAVDTAVLEAAAAALDIRLEDTGLDLDRLPERVLTTGRYLAMEAYFDRFGPAGRAMMCNSASVQINISHEPGTGLVRWQVLNRIAPVLAALTALSPGQDSTGTSWASLRQAVWRSIDPGRAAPVPVHDAATSWPAYALGAGVMLVRGEHDQVTPVAPGTSFADWLADPLAGRYPHAEDFGYHLTTLFPPVRPRGWLELRCLDACPAPDRDSLTIVVAALCGPLGAPRVLSGELDTGRLWERAARAGLADPELAALAEEWLGLALELAETVTGCALRRRQLAEFVERSATPAAHRQAPQHYRPDLTRND